MTEDVITTSEHTKCAVLCDEGLVFYRNKDRTKFRFFETTHGKMLVVVKLI